MPLILFIKISKRELIAMKRLKKYMWIVNTILFLIVFSIIFVRVSYVFRPLSENRENIVGYYAEDKDTLDVIFIGGSSTFVFWAPYEAWNDYGMVSYDLAANSMSPALLKGFVEEALKTQTPELLVIDLRALDVRDVHEGFYTESYIRNLTDALKYSSTRSSAIRYALEYEQPEYTRDIAEYFDLCMYHSNWQSLDEDNFRYAGNNVKHDFRGFGIVDVGYHKYFDRNDYSYVTEELPLSEDTEQILRELLDYCRDKELNVLFTLNPFYQDSEETKARYNYVERIVEEYGYDFIDANDYYDEMEIDFSHDFYNRDHVNIYGALKFTKFLGSYIVGHYEIPDRRGDYRYDAWNNGYEYWCEAVNEQKSVIDDYIANE